MKAATLSILSDGSVGVVPAHLITDEIFALPRKIFHCANNNLWRFFLFSYLNDTQEDHTFYLVLTNSYS
jgi:hypothetical protein